MAIVHILAWGYMYSSCGLLLLTSFCNYILFIIHGDFLSEKKDSNKRPKRSLSEKTDKNNENDNLIIEKQQKIHSFIPGLSKSINEKQTNKKVS